MLGHDYCQIFNQKYDGLYFLPILRKIVEDLERQPAQYVLPRPKFCTKLEPSMLHESKSGPLVQSYLWQRLGGFFQPNDIVIAEVGTAQFGLPDSTFPANVSYITQIFWSPIGYTVGAWLGACVAAKQ